MPLSSSIAGTTTDFVTTEVDTRWTMAYAAGLGDALACYMDTLDPAHLIAHPLFPVCIEWPLILSAARNRQESALLPEESARGVHATHDLIVSRPIRPPERLRTRLVVAGVEARKPGAFQLTRLETIDESGAPVCATWYGTIFRGVKVEGPDRQAEAAPEPLPPVESMGAPRAEISIPIPATIAHVYSECARIYNPIHTDSAVAKAARLPAIILHGTATLALAVSRIIAAEADNDPTRVLRVAGRFGAMVLMPSEVRLRILDRRRYGDAVGIHFEMLNQEGQAAIRDGYVALRP